MHNDNLKWHKIADSIDAIIWQANNMAIIEVQGKQITLLKYEEEVHACAHKCPHAGGILADGFIDAKGLIVCPLHRYRFNVNNGRNVSGEGYHLRTHSIENREAGLFIGIEESSWLDIFK